MDHHAVLHIGIAGQNAVVAAALAIFHVIPGRLTGHRVRPFGNLQCLGQVAGQGGIGFEFIDAAAVWRQQVAAVQPAQAFFLKGGKLGTDTAHDIDTVAVLIVAAVAAGDLAAALQGMRMVQAQIVAHLMGNGEPVHGTVDQHDGLLPPTEPTPEKPQPLVKGMAYTRRL